jgi:pilus assembly protein CpaF
MVAMANLNIPDKAVRQQVAAAFTCRAAHQAVGWHRRVTAITEITGMEQDTITMQDIYLFDRTGCPGWQGATAFRATASGPSARRAWPARFCDAAGNV